MKITARDTVPTATPVAATPAAPDVVTPEQLAMLMNALDPFSDIASWLTAGHEPVDSPKVRIRSIAGYPAGQGRRRFKERRETGWIFAAVAAGLVGGACDIPDQQPSEVGTLIRAGQS